MWCVAPSRLPNIHPPASLKRFGGEYGGVVMLALCCVAALVLCMCGFIVHGDDVPSSQRECEHTNQNEHYGERLSCELPKVLGYWHILDVWIVND